jgi:hypothetical protein
VHLERLDGVRRERLDGAVDLDYQNLKTLQPLARGSMLLLLLISLATTKATEIAACSAMAQRSR